MWIILTIITISIAGTISPFGRRLGATALWAGKAICPEAARPLLPRGHQDAISHGWPSTLHLIASILPLLAGVFGFIEAWWLGIAALFSTEILGMLVGSLPIYPRTVDKYIAIIAARMHRRYADYVRDGDTIRASPALELAMRLEDLLLIYVDSGVQAPNIGLAANAPFDDLEYLLNISHRDRPT